MAADKDVERHRPVPFISFNPVLEGKFRDVTSVRGDTEAGKDAKWLGVATPKDNWCSDVCGVMTLEVAPKCPASNGSNTVTIGVISGSLASEPVSFTVTTD
jgi:hypothetical protein